MLREKSFSGSGKESTDRELYTHIVIRNPQKTGDSTLYLEMGPLVSTSCMPTLIIDDHYLQVIMYGNGRQLPRIQKVLYKSYLGLMYVMTQLYLSPSCSE